MRVAYIWIALAVGLLIVAYTMEVFLGNPMWGIPAGISIGALTMGVLVNHYDK